MDEISRGEAPQVRGGQLSGPLALAGGGFAAAFFAAACCGLPVLLGSLGLGSGWLVTLAWLAAPHRTILLTAAIILLSGGAGASLWRRHAAVCATGVSIRGLAANALFVVILLVGGALAVLGYLYS